jgi:hypothetical protein
MACAFFNNSLIDSALPIFEACNYKQGLAEIYYRIGKRNQNNPDIGESCVPTVGHMLESVQSDTVRIEISLPV